MRHLQKWIDIISAQQCAAIFTILHLNSMVVPFHLLQIPSVYTLYIIPLGLGIMEEKQKWIQQYNIYEFCYDFTVHLSVYELNNYCIDLIHFITIYIWKLYLWYMKRENRFMYIYCWLPTRVLLQRYFYIHVSIRCIMTVCISHQLKCLFNLYECNQMVNCYLV